MQDSEGGRSKAAIIRALRLEEHGETYKNFVRLLNLCELEEMKKVVSAESKEDLYRHQGAIRAFQAIRTELSRVSKVQRPDGGYA